MTATEHQATQDCWKKIGVSGDGSCPRLVEFGHCRNCPEYAQAGRSLFDRDIPAGFREEWSKALAGAKETEIPGAISVVVFRLGDEFLALKTDVFVRALEPRPVHRVPFRTNRVFQGIVNVDGVLLPCLSVAEIMGMPPPGPESSAADGVRFQRLMVVSRGGARCVFPVDEVLGVVRVLPTQLQKPPQTVSKSATSLTVQVFPMDARTVGLLDESKLFETFKGSLTH